MAEKKQAKPPEAVAREALMGALMDLVSGGTDINKLTRDTEIEYDGTKITLPAHPQKMRIPDAIATLTKRHHEEEQLVEIGETIECFPWDGAHVMMLAMREIYGWAEAVRIPGGFFFPDRKPKSISVECGYGQTTEIMWGRFEIAQYGEDQYLQFGSTAVRGRQVFYLSGEVRKKYRDEVKALAARARSLLKTNSLYRGKAFALPLTDDGSDIDYSEYPKFIDPKATKPDDLIYSDEVLSMVNTNLFTPIQYSEACRAAKIPLKRGVLLEGPYGVGKTMIGSALAHVSDENGWTYILLTQASALAKALEFAALYAPAVVFNEDIDRVIEGERTVSMDSILNTIDGVSAKRSEIITVLTTNHVTKINKAMMRPGRLDAVISLREPDAKAAAKLIRLYGGASIDQNADVTEAAELLSGLKPAVIREVVERAKLYEIGLSGGKLSKIGGDALKVSANTMRNHFDLMKEDDAVLRKEDVLWNTMEEMMIGAVAKVTDRETIDNIESKVENIHRHVC